MSKNHSRWLSFIYCLLILNTVVWLPVAHAQRVDLDALIGETHEFLEVDKAFSINEIEAKDNTIFLAFTIAEGYYLYKKSLSFKAKETQLEAAQLPKAKPKNDQYFGDVEVYYDRLEVRIPYVYSAQEMEFHVQFQGCAEAGLCYPPTSRQFTLANDNIAATVQTSSNTLDVKGDADVGKAFVSEQDELAGWLAPVY